MTSISHSSVTEHGVTYFDYCSVLLQAMYVELDESFIYGAVNFGKVAQALGVDQTHK